MTADRIATLTIRRLTEADRSEVERVAQLDSGRTPAGELLGAEVEGRLLAVIALASGEVVADPFSRTAELRDLLELRAKQISGRRVRSRRRFFAPSVPAASPAPSFGATPGVGPAPPPRL